MKLTPPEKSNISQQMDNNMIPLINVVFLMLIFFMVAGQIQKADPIELTPPQSINDKEEENEANVVLFAKGEQLFADDKAISLDAVANYIATRLEASASPDTFWVQVKADGEMTLEELKPVFLQIKASGLTKVSLATQLHRGQ